MIKRALIITVLSLVGTFSSMWLGHVWTNTVLSKFTFSDYFGLNTLIIAMWLPAIVIFFTIGVVLKKVLKETNNYIWPFSLGVISSLIWLSYRKTLFIEEPSILDIIWVYSELFMPVVGCILGWLIYKTANKSLNQIGAKDAPPG